ncbi:MAG: hypothetical protein AB1765_04350 [Candidatus Hydrogenedentota bacterium]
MEWVITMMTLVAGCVTIAWFIRDVRKENSKILKSMLDVQKTSLDVQREMAQILVKIEEGQREGFRMLSEDMTKLGAIFERVCVIFERVSLADR